MIKHMNIAAAAGVALIKWLRPRAQLFAHCSPQYHMSAKLVESRAFSLDISLVGHAMHSKQSMHQCIRPGALYI